MSTTQLKADALAQAVRYYHDKNPRANIVEELPMFEALVAYESQTSPEAAPDEKPAAHCTFCAATENLLCIKHAHEMYALPPALEGHCQQEINMLAAVLLKEFGGPNCSESACAMAVRLLRATKELNA